MTSCSGASPRHSEATGVPYDLLTSYDPALARSQDRGSHRPSQGNYNSISGGSLRPSQATRVPYDLLNSNETTLAGSF
ncbi:hypothetical protein Y032_0048g1543, partial [Ancylostoma ceylanicum]